MTETKTHRTQLLPACKRSTHTPSHYEGLSDSCRLRPGNTTAWSTKKAGAKLESLTEQKNTANNPILHREVNYIHTSKENGLQFHLHREVNHNSPIPTTAVKAYLSKKEKKKKANHEEKKGARLTPGKKSGLTILFSNNQANYTWTRRTNSSKALTKTTTNKKKGRLPLTSAYVRSPRFSHRYRNNAFQSPATTARVFAP